MSMFMKKGSVMLNEETIGIVIAAAALIIIAYVVFSAFSFGYNVQDKTLESYEQGIKRTVKDLEEHKIAEYTPAPSGKPDEFYFLVYFGERISYANFLFSEQVEGQFIFGAGKHIGQYITTEYQTDFFTRRINRHTMCVCSVELDVDDVKRYLSDSTLRNRHYRVESDSQCTKCIDFDYPVEVHGPQPPIYDLDTYTFLFERITKEDSTTAYRMTVTEKG